MTLLTRGKEGEVLYKGVRGFKGAKAPEHAYAHLQKNYGIDPGVSSQRLHKIKEGAGLKATDSVIIDLSGNVYRAETKSDYAKAGQRLGTLTDKSLGGK